MKKYLLIINYKYLYNKNIKETYIEFADNDEEIINICDLKQNLVKEFNYKKNSYLEELKVEIISHDKESFKNLNIKNFDYLSFNQLNTILKFIES